METGEVKGTPSTLVIIVALNEEEGIGPTIAELISNLASPSVLVVGGRSARSSCLNYDMLCFLKYDLNAVFSVACLARNKKWEKGGLRCIFQSEGEKVGWQPWFVLTSLLAA